MANAAGSNPFWQKNLSALERTNPPLAERLVSYQQPITRYIAARANDGSPVLGVSLESGKIAALCMTNNPQQEAEEWALGLDPTILKCGHVMLVGFGSGYHPLYLYRLSDSRTTIWIVEPDLVLLKAVLNLMDFTPLLSSPRVHLAVGLPAEEVPRMLFQGASANRMRAQGIQMLYTGISKYMYRQYIDDIKRSMEVTIATEGLKFRTSEIQGETILRNVLANLPYVLKAAPCQRLIHQFVGCPALVIGPGPCLNDQISWLKKNHRRGIVICVDTAYRTLYRHEISVDLVCSLDFTELNAKHYDTISRPEAFLLAFPGIDPSIMRRFEGRTYLFDHAGSVRDSSRATPLLKVMQSLGPVCDLVSYGSTSHIAYHIARRMGCSPIVLLGHDLSFPGSKWYVDGVMQNELRQPEREREELLEVRSNDGGTVYTSGLYKFYLDSFGELIHATGGSVINTSPHGARIECTVWRTLDQVARFLPDYPLDKSALHRLLTPSLEDRSSRLKEEIQAVTSQCRSVDKKIRRLIESLESISPHATGFRGEMIKTMKGFTHLLNEEPVALKLAIPLCVRQTLALLGALDQVDLFGGDTPAMNQQAHARCIEFLADFDKAIRVNIEEFQTTLDRW